MNWSERNMDTKRGLIVPTQERMNFVEAGLTLLATDDMQLDVNTGLQVDPGRTAFFLGVGVAVRV